MGLLSYSKSTSDLPSWLSPGEHQELKGFLASSPRIEPLDQFRIRIGDHQVDFSILISLPGPKKFPPKPALVLGLYDMITHEVVPDILESFKKCVTIKSWYILSL